MNQFYSFARLESALNTSIYVPACLPSSDADYVDKNVWVVGWGRTQEGGQVSDTLQELQIQAVDDATCYSAMSGQTFANENICAGGEAGKDGCQGDSGGPLLYNDAEKWELAGIVSWGLGCAREGFYGIYTEVPCK